MYTKIGNACKISFGQRLQLFNFIVGITLCWFTLLIAMFSRRHCALLRRTAFDDALLYVFHRSLLHSILDHA